MVVNKGQEFIQAKNLEWESAGDGVRRKIAAYDDHLMAAYVEFQKGAVGVLHSHPHRQITYVESGAFEVNIGGKKEVLRSGDFYYIPPDVEHGVITLEPGTLVDMFSPARKDFLKERE
jgi:quercetin dioxygenase-like cupin family protein